MKLKAGPIYCIKNYYEFDDLYCIKGKTYMIEIVNDFHAHVKCENDLYLKFNIFSPFREATFPHYFMTAKKLRKEKLKKLNFL